LDPSAGPFSAAIINGIANTFRWDPFNFAISWLSEGCDGDSANIDEQLQGGTNLLLSSYLILLQSFSRRDAQFSIDL
jgi:hypothetical protein